MKQVNQTFVVSQLKERIDPFANGAEVRKVANGFVVMTPRDWNCGSSSDFSDTHVFRDSTELGAWMRKRYAEAGK